MAELIGWFNAERQAGQLHPLLLIGIRIVVFLEIHPFQDGNGRLSRVLTTLLLSGRPAMPTCLTVRWKAWSSKDCGQGRRSASLRSEFPGTGNVRSLAKADSWSPKADCPLCAPGRTFRKNKRYVSRTQKQPLKCYPWLDLVRQCSCIPESQMVVIITGTRNRAIAMPIDSSHLRIKT